LTRMAGYVLISTAANGYQLTTNWGTHRHSLPLCLPIYLMNEGQPITHHTS